jgi:hypothetical protein
MNRKGILLCRLQLVRMLEIGVVVLKKVKMLGRGRATESCLKGNFRPCCVSDNKLIAFDWRTNNPMPAFTR